MGRGAALRQATSRAAPAVRNPRQRRVRSRQPVRADQLQASNLAGRRKNLRNVFPKRDPLGTTSWTRGRNRNDLAICARGRSFRPRGIRSQPWESAGEREKLSCLRRAVSTDVTGFRQASWSCGGYAVRCGHRVDVEECCPRLLGESFAGAWPGEPHVCNAR